jgi:hypothetical protein
MIWCDLALSFTHKAGIALPGTSQHTTRSSSSRARCHPTAAACATNSSSLACKTAAAAATSAAANTLCRYSCSQLLLLSPLLQHLQHGIAAGHPHRLTCRPIIKLPLLKQPSPTNPCSRTYSSSSSSICCTRIKHDRRARQQHLKPRHNLQSIRTLPTAAHYNARICTEVHCIAARLALRSALRSAAQQQRWLPRERGEVQALHVF